ncbi:MAG: ABC transporter permease [bacterium]|nr:ABC transporter permease [bacterium]
MKNWIPYEWFVARRYLSARRRTGFITLIAWISILGVTIGVAALIIVLSVMNGFESEVRSRIIGFDTHIRVRSYHDDGISNPAAVMEQIRGIPHVIGLSPYILEKGMIQAGDRNDGCLIRGADPETLDQVSDLSRNMAYGRLDLGPVSRGDGRTLPGIVLGRYLADRLLAEPGDVVTVFSPSGIRSMLQMPPVKQFIVTGYFETGMYEYDNTYVYISNAAAQELFRMGGRVSGIEVRLDDLYKADAVVDTIEKRLGFPYYPMTWFEMRKNLFSWMQLEKIAMFIILSLIIMVAAFNIISTIIMVVMEKTKEIGILKSIGATSGGVMRLFLCLGVGVGIVGTALGLAVGYGLCWAQQTYKFISLPGDVYFISVMPVRMQATDFLYIGLASVLICLVASIYPAKKAADLVPVEAIRYE